MITRALLLLIAIALPLAATGVCAQAAGDNAMALPRYPVRAPGDPAKVARGRGLYSVNCSFCHGGNGKGGESGPSLVRSEVVLNDKDGELISPVVLQGRIERGMPKFSFSATDLSDITTFIHSIPVGEAARSGAPVINPVVGNARAGQKYFNGAGKCTSCHSVTGDLAKVGSKYPAPRNLQGAMLMGAMRVPPGGGFAATPLSIPAGTTVDVTLGSGEVLKGKLERIDEFLLTLTDANGASRSVVRDAGISKIEIHNPSQAHLDLLRVIRDTDIQNLTAYLVTLK